MKTFKKVLALVLVAVLCFALASCSMVDDTDITKDNIKIGVVLPGQRDDADDYVPDLSTLQCVSAINDLISFGSGINKDRFRYIEHVDPSNEQAAYDAIHSLTNQECSIIFLADSSYMSAVNKYVSNSSSDVQKSKVQYIVFNGEDNGKNIHSYTANISAPFTFPVLRQVSRPRNSRFRKSAIFSSRPTTLRSSMLLLSAQSPFTQRLRSMQEYARTLSRTVTRSLQTAM